MLAFVSVCLGFLTLAESAPHFCGDHPEAGANVKACVAKPFDATIRVCDLPEDGDGQLIFTTEPAAAAEAMFEVEVVEGMTGDEPWAEIHLHRDRVQSTDTDTLLCFGYYIQGEGTSVINMVATKDFEGNDEVYCYNLEIRYAPEFVPPTPLPNYDMEEATTTAKICEASEFQITANDQNLEDDVTIFVMEDPGLPNGAVVSSNVCPKPAPNLEGDLVKRPCNSVSRTFLWTPAKSQEGKTYRVCFVARDNQNFCQLGGRYSLLVHGEDLCVQIFVIKPAPRWKTPPTPQPSLVVVPGHDQKAQLIATASTDFSDQARNGLARHAHVGCSTTFTVSATDEHYCVNINVLGEAPLPPGADLTCTSIGMQGESMPNTADRCTTDLTRSCNFAWTPKRGTEGQTHEVCFEATDNICTEVLHDGNLQSDLPPVSYASSHPEEDNKPLCFPIYVARCRYCARKGDTLHYITKHYHIDTHWLRLWNTNGNDDRLDKKNLDTDPDITTTIHDPDNILHENDVINVGPTYKVQVGDTLVQLADRFHTTVKKIMSVNPDVGASGDSDDKIQSGQELCILLCTDALDIDQMTYKYAY